MGPIRNRKALSCVDCRRRKVKCDRTLPVCVRCQKGNNAQNCKYVPYADSDAEKGDSQHGVDDDNIEGLVTPWARENPIQRAGSIAHGLPTPQTTVTEAEQKVLEKILPRVVNLESHVRSSRLVSKAADITFGIGNPSDIDYPAERNPMSDYDKVMVRGKSFKTQYFGPSFPLGMLLQFEELSKFEREIVRNMADFNQVKSNMVHVRGQLRIKSKQPVLYDLQTLLSMVPSRSVTDTLVNQYLDTFETTYRVLHVPSFLRDYESFCSHPTASDPGFIAQLLLVMAAVYCVVPGGVSGYVGRGSAKREVASRWIKACESWLEEQSQKHMKLLHFQIHVLIFIAKAMTRVKIKREWTSSGYLLRMAMGAGMHREPGLLCRGLSEFDCEMKRRLWFTVVELDLVTTIYKGMSPSIDAMAWDCQPPSNIHDEDFDESTKKLPASRPRSEFTRTSFLHAINEHLDLRVEILGRVNSVRRNIDLEAVMHYDHKIRKHIDDIPAWSSNPLSVFASHEFKLMLYEFVLILHVPFASQTPNSASYLYPTASKRDVSIKTLKLYTNLPEQHKVQLLGWRRDQCRAALALCHDLVSSLEDDTTNSNSGSLQDQQKTLELVYTMVSSMEDLVRTLGEGFHGFWITMTAYALIQTKLTPPRPPTRFAQIAADRVAKLFEEGILRNQVAMPALDGSVEDGTSITLQSNTDNTSATAVDEAFRGLDSMNGMVDPMWDFMGFDFSSVWDLNAYNDQPPTF